jgi:hydrogenase maturation protease
MEDALALGVDALRRWGAAPVERHEPLAEDESVTFPLLAIERYEGQRPSEALACRVGDDRFMPAVTPT